MCNRCTRHGRVQLAKLIADHGADMGLPDLAVRLAGNCPKVTATSTADRCFVIFPHSNLLGEFEAPRTGLSMPPIRGSRELPMHNDTHRGRGWR